MRKILLGLCGLLLITTAFKKKDASYQPDIYWKTHDTIPATMFDEDTSIIYTKVDVEPKFRGDGRAWQMFLMNTLNAEIPIKKRARNGQYTVVIEFLVEKDGTTKNYKALTKHGYGMEEECIRVIKLSGNWEPAMQGGQAVRYYRKQPITFVISED